MINAPVLHVNGDYPQGIVFSSSLFLSDLALPDVARAMETAFKYRHFFRKVSDPEKAAHLSLLTSFSIPLNRT